MITVHDAMQKVIARWEGGFQDMAADPGNWVNGNLVGTMRGVTPAVLASYRGVPVGSITKQTMLSVTLDEAASIAVAKFYNGTGLDRLPWGPATDVIVDFGWGAGPGQACRTIQRHIGVDPDGIIGPASKAAYSAWVNKCGSWEGAVRSFHIAREGFYDLICARNPALMAFRAGWRNRSRWFMPESTEWWGPWQADMPPMPVGGQVVK